MIAKNSALLSVRLANARERISTGLGELEQNRHAKARQCFVYANTELLELARLSTDARVKQSYLDEVEKLNRLLERIKQPQAERVSQEEVAEKPVFKSLQSDINFSDVVGMVDVKKQLVQRMCLPFEFANEAERWEIEAGGGILLYGPPGTGKTFIARAAAGELGAAFYSVKSSDMMSKWVGNAEKNIAALFEAARNEERAVVFIDELEALTPKRGSTGSSIMARVVPQFLAELDGIEGKRGNILLMGATNLPWQLDPAMLRGGRLDALIYVGLPDIYVRTALFNRYLGNKPIDKQVNFECLADLARGMSAADIKTWCDQIALDGFERSLNDAEFVLDADNLENGVRHYRRSVSAKQLQKYNQFEQEAA